MWVAFYTLNGRKLQNSKIIVQPYVAKKLPNCALRGKSTKLGTMILLDELIIFSYEPHPNTHVGRHNVPLGGGVWSFCSIVHLYGKIIVHLGVKAPHLAW